MLYAFDSPYKVKHSQVAAHVIRVKDYGQWRDGVLRFGRERRRGIDSVVERKDLPAGITRATLQLRKIISLQMLFAVKQR